MSKFDIEAMRSRIEQELDRQRRSRTEVSLASGNSKGYLTNILSRGQVPTVDRLQAICDALGVSMAYIMYGVDIPPDSNEVFDLMKRDPEKFRALVALLR